MADTRWRWTGIVSMLLLAAVTGSRVLVSLGVPGFRNLAIPWIGIAMSATFGVAQYIQWARQERKDLSEAQQLKSRPASSSTP
jgi:hypothetical protein